MIGCFICLLCWGCLRENPLKPVTPSHAHQQESPVIAEETGEPEITPSQATTETPPASNDIEHHVQWEKETLSIIARWYTGALANWKALEAANPEINPHILHIHTRIRIPGTLIINRTPMPKAFIDQFYMNKKPAVLKDPDPESEEEGIEKEDEKEEEEDIQLFGPRPFQTD